MKERRRFIELHVNLSINLNQKMKNERSKNVEASGIRIINFLATLIKYRVRSSVFVT